MDHSMKKKKKRKKKKEKIKTWSNLIYRGKPMQVPSFIKVFSGVRHTAGSTQTLAKRTRRHIHKCKFLK